jgi:hypothetical protein
MDRAFNSDRALLRLERGSLVTCLVMAAVAWAARSDMPSLALGVLGGGLLIASSYRAIKDGIDLLVAALGRSGQDRAEAPGGPAPEAATPGGDDTAAREEGASDRTTRPRLSRRQRLFLGVKFIARYALLAVGAYAMLVVLHLHPVGLVMGVSSPVVAAAIEVIRMSRRLSRPGNPE